MRAPACCVRSPPRYRTRAVDLCRLGRSARARHSGPGQCAVLRGGARHSRRPQAAVGPAAARGHDVTDSAARLFTARNIRSGPTGPRAVSRRRPESAGRRDGARYGDALHPDHTPASVDRRRAGGRPARPPPRGGRRRSRPTTVDRHPDGRAPRIPRASACAQRGGNIGGHLRKVFAKLDISLRREVAAALRADREASHALSIRASNPLKGRRANFTRRTSSPIR